MPSTLISGFSAYLLGVMNDGLRKFSLEVKKFMKSLFQFYIAEKQATSKLSTLETIIIIFSIIWVDLTRLGDSAPCDIG